jgi:3',5'-cyclic AMP phosphodiesterase CpdA
LWKASELVVTLTLAASICCQPDEASLLPSETRLGDSDGNASLVARFVHITDAHIIDVESPARLTGADDLVPYAWRPWESSSTQILDGIIRTTNRIHAGGSPIDFAIVTGDNCDNDQSNELGWFLALMEGGTVTPLSGPDDRATQDRPSHDLDPFAAFEAQGLYRSGIHGDLPSIPWYTLAGNHEAYSLGTFPIETLADGHRIGLLPLPLRVGIWLPRFLDPVGSLAYSPISPAVPGPSPLLTVPVQVVANPDRAYFDMPQYIQALQATQTEPGGHGFLPGGAPWYSVSPAPGLRLLGLFTSQQLNAVPEIPNQEGCILADQLDWLKAELDAATSRGELVIVASHHPSEAFEIIHGSAVTPDSFRRLLSEYPCVILHLAGHYHRNRVVERGSYLEIETCSTIDWPQEARLIELWRESDGSISIGYDMYSHVDDRWPALGDDPLYILRLQALQLAQDEASPTFRSIIPGEGAAFTSAERAGEANDRSGLVRLP